MTKTEIAGITRANEGMQGISWNILGQTYVPKNVTEHSFSWHATFPPDTCVPPHIHPDQGLEVALERMGANQLEILPVVSRANVHKLEGIVTLRDVLDSYGIGPFQTVTDRP